MDSIIGLIEAGACVYPNPLKLLHAGHKLSVMQIPKEVQHKIKQMYGTHHAYPYLEVIPLETMETTDLIGILDLLDETAFLHIIVKQEFSDGGMHAWQFDNNLMGGWETFCSKYQRTVQ